LDGNETSTAFDIYSFCEILGPKEGNKQLKRHWETWVTEDIIDELANSEAVNSLRLPVGDYMYKPYGPYGKMFCVAMMVFHDIYSKLHVPYYAI
jgi:aryl-phospho-beta-D-glucosidase BglC (GH1 family)